MAMQRGYAAIQENEATTTNASSTSNLRTIIESILRVYFVRGKTRKARRDCLDTAFNQRRSKMKKAILGALLIAASTVQMVSAAEHHVRRAHHQSDFRGSYNQLIEPHRNIENFGLGATGNGSSFLHPSDITPSGS
jgi:hypothetical protein